MTPYDQNVSSDFFDPEWMFGVRKGFDVVIGNPPYVVSSDRKLRQIYNESVYGRPNLYGFFIHRGIETLLRENGVLTFINPRTLLTDSYFSALRAFILKHVKVKSVLNIIDRRNVFEAVLQSCIVNIFQKSKLDIDVSVKNIESKEDLHELKWLTIPNEDFLFRGGQEPIFIVADSIEAYNIFKKIKSMKDFQSYGLSFTTGKIQWDYYKDVLSPNRNPNSTRLIWAENIQRYMFAPNRNRADRIFINAPLRRFSPITHDTIIVQRTTAVEQKNRIIATIVSPNYFGVPIQAENHTSYLQKNDYKINLKYILGLLNSRLLDHIFRHINSNTQVSAGELNSLPFVDVAPNRQAPIISLVNQILSAKKANPNADTAGLEREIDQLVYELYDLTEEEIAIVEESSPGEIGEVNINTASASELAMLDGVGPETADLIISGRPYSKAEDLLKVRGIGKKTLEGIRDKIAVE